MGRKPVSRCRKGDGMRRLGRVLLLLASVAALAPVRAQTPEKMYRVVVLSPAPVTMMVQEILPEIAKHGFDQGRNLVVESRFGGADEMPRLAHELLAGKPDAIFAVAPPAARAAAAATSTIPIVFLVSADPIAAGWVNSLARPGRNITGVTILGPELDPKRLQVIHELIPAARRMAVLRDPAVSSDERRRQIEAAARDLGIAIDIVEARTPDEIAGAMREARQLGATAINVLASPLFSTQATKVATEAIGARLATMCHWREMVEAGCLASYGPTFAETYRLAGAQLGRILAGARVANMPVEQPTKFELIINLRTARALNLTIPLAVLANANEVIE
jgi:putative tryptophan/tyrosine transport system substrate-binding protein